MRPLFSLANVISNLGVFNDTEGPYHFHHTGIIFHVQSSDMVADITPEEHFSWHDIDSLDFSILSPLASKAVRSYLFSQK